MFLCGVLVSRVVMRLWQCWWRQRHGRLVEGVSRGFDTIFSQLIVGIFGMNLLPGLLLLLGITASITGRCIYLLLFVSSKSHVAASKQTAAIYGSCQNGDNRTRAAMTVYCLCHVDQCTTCYLVLVEGSSRLLVDVECAVNWRSAWFTYEMSSRVSVSWTNRPNVISALFHWPEAGVFLLSY